MTQSEIDNYLRDLRNQLIRISNHRKILMTREWSKLAPSTAGVYILIQDKKIVYVGESGNLRGRMTDLLDSRHHTVRRTIGRKYYSSQEGFKTATSKTKFPAHIEALVNSHICERFYMPYLEVSIGRKELEEYIQKEIDEDVRLNIRGKRIAR